MALRNCLPEPLEAIHHSIRESNGGGTVACEPGSIACNNSVPLSESEVVQPAGATSSVAVRDALGANRLRG